MSSKAFGTYNVSGSLKNQHINNPMSYLLTAQQLHQAKKIDHIDSMMGFDRYIPPQSSISDKNRNYISGKVGWLCNIHPTMVSQDIQNDSDSSTSVGISGVDFYFLSEEGESFKSTITYDPYFFISCYDDTHINAIEEFLKIFLKGSLKSVQIISKDDLSLNNHLVGIKKTLLKLSFSNSNNLFEAKKLLAPIIQRNKDTQIQRDIYQKEEGQSISDIKTLLEDIKEYDVPYHVRVSIDKNIRVGKWYKITSHGFLELSDKLAFADPIVLAFDIETTKAPLKFPDASVDQIMMISYMIDGDGYLITNREVISEDIEDFEYTPKAEYPGQFTIFNESSEMLLIMKFFEHIRDVKPTVISTFNGDFFDWPFVEARAKIHGLNMFDEIGFAPDSEGEYKSSYCAHMDCYRWVKRDSYLPQGSQGLKAVTQVKLGYNPMELDPELMTIYAYENPQHLSEYSVSDAVATYYLYMKYVHPFIFSLCTIIPLNPDEVLRKGTGTLCEMLLMVQAYNNNILLPNKHTNPLERFYDGHLLETETYVGGHVESLKAGVFRNDIKNDFKIDPSAIDELLNDLSEALKFCIEVENNTTMDKVTNFIEIKDSITNKLLDLKENHKRNELPLIYHVDVASMYPNIMATNRLQPDSIKSERYCASCDFNRPGKTCDRRLPWSWRGDFFPAKMDEYNMVKRALQNETFPNKNSSSKKRYVSFDELSYSEQVSHIKKRLTDYSRKVYHRIKVTETVEREAIICQRENPFYVNTVRSFRDRRYEFKGLAKTWKSKLVSLDSQDIHAQEEARKMIVLYDSLQLAHKVILNSFYGYVMRKGSRWYSIEMAGITCLTGATIIQMAKSLIERIGSPLELDTDGIWCIFPKSFPENFEFTLQNGKKLFMSYPCSMLNYKVHQRFTNHQYQILDDPIKYKYKTQSDNSIFFEVDGPYRAMILPTSKEEGKGIKKRYAVFNNDGSLAELKGFELKRRGELQLIKNFQNDIFKVFLEGNTLEGCYSAVAAVANRWLDVLDTKGMILETEDLISLICENKSMSKKLKDYNGQKSTSITTAKRLGEFLGEEMVKDAGLQCKFIISSKPYNAPVTERAIPVAIFSADLSIKKTFLRRWLLDSSINDFDPRAIIDWDYYKERLSSVIQKIITIPAALQNVKNPVPRVQHPEWLQKKILLNEDKFKQTSLNRFFKKTSETPKVIDMENIFEENDVFKTSKIARVNITKNSKRKRNQEFECEELVLPSKIPSICDDYVTWLQYQKIKWKIQSKERTRRAQLFGANSVVIDRSSIGNIMRKHAETYANSIWEILQYKNSFEPGVVDVFALINGKVQILKFNIPKTVYMNFKTNTLPPGGIRNCLIEKSSAHLANSSFTSDSDNSTLFKLSLSESTFVDEIQKVSSIFNNENVLGIYESSIMPTSRAILDLGTCVEFKSNIMGTLGRSLQYGFDMKNISSVTCERYLQNFSLEISYILHLSTNIGYEFFIISKNGAETSQIFVLKPNKNAQELSCSAMETIYRESYKKRSLDLKKFSHLFDVKETMTFKLCYFTDLEKLYDNLSKQVSIIKEEKGSYTLILLQSPFIKKIMTAVKSFNQFPIIEIGMNELTLPNLNWQTILMNKISVYILSLNKWIFNLISLSRYSNVPLCNLKLDSLGYIIDVLYGRQLQKNNIVLWWNEINPLPDHGGCQNEFDLSRSMQLRDLEISCINIPEIYDSVVLEFEINNLTENTILTSALINDAEGTDLANIDNDLKSKNSNLGFIKDAFSGTSLSVLRLLLKQWWDDALKGDTTADSLVHSFISWVQNPNSKLFDYTLRYHVSTITKKALLQLANELKSLGSSVIFVNRNKVFLKTTKSSVENSYAYGQYIIKAIRTKPLFNYLDLNIKRYWDLLVWMDQYNFGGRGCLSIQEKEQQDLQAYSKWQIKEFLSPIYQPEFDDWMLIILDSLIKTKERFYEININTQRSTQISHKKEIDEQNNVSSLTGFTNIFAPSLLTRVQKLLRNQQEYILDPNFVKDYSTPILPGTHLDTKNPLLELIKYLSHILLLSHDTSLEVRVLRKELLKIFEIREFDSIGIFKNPSTSLVINNFICEHCAFTTDLDICKEMPENIFECRKCHRPLNKTLIEEYLIQKLELELNAYIVQDLRCSKCNKIKTDYMSEYCPCSGSWALTITEKNLLDQIKIFRNIAKYYDFDLLSNLIDDLT